MGYMEENEIKWLTGDKDFKWLFLFRTVKNVYFFSCGFVSSKISFQNCFQFDFHFLNKFNPLLKYKEKNISIQTFEVKLKILSDFVIFGLQFFWNSGLLETYFTQPQCSPCSRPMRSAHHLCTVRLIHTINQNSGEKVSLHLGATISPL